MRKILLMSVMASSIVIASGYKVPEVSTNAVALGSANIAHNHKNADSAYYNPANMVFMSNENHIESGLTYIGLEKVNFKGSGSDAGTDESSQRENFFIPSFHYVSGLLGERARVGVSIVTPAGLSKRWKGTKGSKSAEEFTLEVVEVNPTVALQVSEHVGIAFGFRAIHSFGIVNATPSPNAVYQDMTGDSLDFGYNLAVAYKPMKALEFGITYRSKVNLTIDGDADLKYPNKLDGNYDVFVDLPLPATLSVAVAYTFPTKTTLEFVYEKTYWSTYKTLDFEYTDPVAEGIFGVSHSKDWKDTNAFRIGVTQELETLTLMAGLVFDKSPVPESTLGFELPDADSTALSLGGRYKVNEKMNIGLSALYSVRESRAISNSSLTGEFSDGNVLILSAGLGYKF